MYAKLKNGKLIKPILFKNNIELLGMQGFKEVKLVEKPVREGYFAISSYTETEDKIIQSWTLEPTQQIITLEDRVEALEEAVLELAMEEQDG